MAVSDYSTTASDNTAIGGINIGEGCLPGNLNDAIRQMMADIAGYVTVGSNSNGVYLNLEGYQLCWIKKLTLNYDNAASCVGRWTFPNAFSSTTNLSVQATFTSAGDAVTPGNYASDATPTSGQISELATGTLSTNSVDLAAIRIAGTTDFQSGDAIYANVFAFGPVS